jgi:hypothetical protein
MSTRRGANSSGVALPGWEAAALALAEMRVIAKDRSHFAVPATAAGSKFECG